MSDTYTHHSTDRRGTIRAYEYAWKKYTEWCTAEGREPWHDPDGSTFVAFVTAMVRDGIKATTVSQMRAALAYRYDTDPSLYGKPCPTRSDAAKAEMRKLRKRDKRRTQRQAHEVTPDEIERLAAVSAMPRRGESIDDTHIRHAENYATMCTMFDAALRLDDMARIEWGHLDHRPNDNGDRNLSVPPGKTDEARDAVITPRTYQALMAWRALSPTPDGRISTATSSATLGQRIRRLGQHADIPVTGHSFRRGRATKLAADGASEYDIMSIGGWKSPQMVNTYVNKQAARKVNGRLYPNGHAATSEASESINYMAQKLDNYTALLPNIAALHMAVALDADQHHPAVKHAIDQIIALWPTGAAPPRWCARPGCPGLLPIDVQDHARYCNTRCKDKEHYARTRKATT